MSHRKARMKTIDVGVFFGTDLTVITGTRKIHKKPVSNNCDSQPKIENSKCLLIAFS